MAGCHEVRVRWTVLESTKEDGRTHSSRMSPTQLDKFSVRGTRYSGGFAGEVGALSLSIGVLPLT